MAAKYPNFSHECPMPSISRKNKSCASQSRACIQHKAIIQQQGHTCFRSNESWLLFHGDMKVSGIYATARRCGQERQKWL